ncbi:MAG: biotin/lipoyl-binding protein [Candidatus Latescibacteria bacterium]|nr:biotin/lipoyl-binding protein [Candidatus Latescibacterota bacterium]
MRAALWGLVLLLACQQAPKSTTYTGVLEGRSTRVPALLGGRLLEVRVEEGAVVALGDTLALVDTLELAIQARQVEAGREELAVRRRSPPPRWRAPAPTSITPSKRRDAFAPWPRTRPCPGRTLTICTTRWSWPARPARVPGSSSAC